MAEAPAARFVTPFEDSRRWRNIVRRPGDIVISAPLGPATMWTQRIVTKLLSHAHREEPAWYWPDDVLTPIDRLVDELEAETHRRCMLTHSPADCIPFDATCRYIVACSDWRDGFAAWAAHWTAKAAQAGDQTTDDPDTVMHLWLQHSKYTPHIASWWDRRHDSNVLFVHHGDIATDPGGQVARIASFLELSITAVQQSVAIVQREIQWDGVRWADELTTESVQRHLEQVAETLSAQALAWLKQGSAALGRQPGEIGAATTNVLDTGAFHPIFNRLAKHRPNNSIDAITDRRVDDARAAGLFDNLPLHGKPIPDIDRSRRHGWWANQFVAKERNKVAALELEEELRSSMPALWRLETEAQVETEINALNTKVAAYNRVTTLQPMKLLILDETLNTWRSLKQR